MKNPPLDLLKYRSFPELGTSLRNRAERIVQRWEKIVREVLPRAEELTFTQLRDDVPRILHQMAEALEADEPAAVHELVELSAPHGAQRFHQHYNINELLVEYHLLRRVTLEEVANHVGRPLEVAELVSLNLGIDTAMRRGVVVYAEHQTAQLTSANELQSRYLSFLSHDLRGGLNGTLLMIEVLKREMATESRFAETLEDLDVMRRSILDTVGTMDRFLHAELFRKGKMEVRPSTLDINAMLKELVNQASYQARAKGVELRHDLQEGSHGLTSDKELLTLIFQNILSNAIKYSPSGKVVTVSSRALPGGPEGRGCLISIADHGPGIAPGHIADIFTPFKRGETHGQKGAGLGLSIAKQAADLLSAQIIIDSTPGGGSTFSVQVPDYAKPPGHREPPAQLP